VARLSSAVQASLADPLIKTRLETAVGGEARGSTSAEMHDLLTREIKKWNAVIDAGKIPRL
jgi:hypothetical protein